MTLIFSLNPLFAAKPPITYCDTEGLIRSEGPQARLIVGLNSNSKRNIWSQTMRQQLTYCISDQFKGLKPKLTKAFEDAVKDWQRYANVRFIYLREHDKNCNSSNTNVLFRVNMFSDERGYAARAFLPYASRSQRNILFSKKFVSGSSRILLYLTKHELGHVLGFRHEHIHAENNGRCSEGGRYSSVTSYDKLSIMHYQQCDGKPLKSFLSRDDKKGAAIVYP